jgi:DNA-binding NarL/FixJ family response regulator
MMTATKLIRVMLVEDDELTRLGLQTQIKKDPLLEVVCEAANRKDAVRLAADKQPDIILLDLNLGSESGLEFLPELISAAPSARTIVVTGVLDLEAHQRAISHGAMGLVLKQDAVEHMARAVKQVYNGDVWFNRSMMLKVIERMAQSNAPKKPDPEAAKIKTLTAREREVVDLVGEGLKNKAIADRLYISETTVRHHLTSIFAKLEVSDRLELVIYAYKYGLATLPK